MSAQSKEIKKQTIKKYIRDQQKEDILSDQITLKEYANPFKG